MRSSPDEGQLSLWDSGAAPARQARREHAGDVGDRTVVVTGPEFASRGWGPGTVLHHQPATRAVRGELAVVRDGEDLLVGFWGLEIGRPALFTDAGSTWLGESARVVGVVRAVEAPLSF
ncbi:hypothetical protein GHK92_19315 [Nocardioides sp. dk4132]|uniref:hypothetical protein n=1 Tax=unclassified Nocardioides TaxID=2615069 RepID=UPI0012952B98|nr:MULTISPECIES: hypothetical protein [unclassified Nocardioides]MQW78021.1 hypothetical protein [Nocardioides sp. dk4132]QGA08128.1 hypothetical protein GFH29_12495 [Nocardioides sp. dk884]